MRSTDASRIGTNLLIHQVETFGNAKSLHFIITPQISNQHQPRYILMLLVKMEFR